MRSTVQREFTLNAQNVRSHILLSVNVQRKGIFHTIQGQNPFQVSGDAN
jgi:hypothetical protein